MRVLFRVDATTEIGSGHFMRCLNLADSMKPFSAKICFICYNLPNYLRALLAEKCYDFLPLNRLVNLALLDDLTHSHWLGTSQDLDALDTIQLAGGGWDWLVVDHYGIDSRWEIKLRQSTKKILVVDDLADRQHDCDLLLDQNLFIDLDTRYNNKVPTHCVLLLGPRFVLLRDEFVRLRKQCKERNGSIKRVLVFFGSVDLDNHTASAIQALVNINNLNLQVDVVIGIQHPDLQQIQSLCKDNNFICHIQTQHMAELILAADLAIGAGGISTYERIFLRLPAILKPVSFNQIEALKYMSNMGLFELFSTSADLEVKLRYILKRENFSPPDCVEDGSNKLAKLMVAEFTKLNCPKPLDVRRTFNWLHNKQLREDFVMASSPRRPEHFMYWRKLLHDPDQRVFSIFYFDKHVGSCGLKNINIEKCKSEIWIYLADLSARGHGVADRAVVMLLEKARNDLPCYKVYLHVAKTNSAAIRLYKNNGFYEIEKLLEGRWAGRDANILYMEQVI